MKKIFLLPAVLLFLSILPAEENEKKIADLEKDAALLRKEILELENRLLKQDLDKREKKRIRERIQNWYDKNRLSIGFLAGYEYFGAAGYIRSTINPHFINYGTDFFLSLRNRYVIGLKSVHFIAADVHRNENKISGKTRGVRLGIALNPGRVSLIPGLVIGKGEYTVKNRLFSNTKIYEDIPFFSAEGSLMVTVKLGKNTAVALSPFYLYTMGAPLEGFGGHVFLQIINPFS